MSAPVLSWPFNVPGNGSPEGPPPAGRSQGCAAGSTAKALTPLPSHQALPWTSKTAGPRTPGPQSQSFSRSYGSILPTSLTYIVLSTRGCTPWRPDAVMSTPGGGNDTRVPRLDFQGPSRALQTRARCMCSTSHTTLSPGEPIPG